jgi:hypothetical protein
MFDALMHPERIALIAFIAIVALLIGALRRDPPLAIAATSTGFVIGWIGVMWAGDIGQDALGALLVATIGIALTVHGNDRAKAAKARREAEAQASGHQTA